MPDHIPMTLAMCDLATTSWTIYATAERHIVRVEKATGVRLTFPFSLKSTLAYISHLLCPKAEGGRGLQVDLMWKIKSNLGSWLPVLLNTYWITGGKIKLSRRLTSQFKCGWCYLINTEDQDWWISFVYLKNVWCVIQRSWLPWQVYSGKSWCPRTTLQMWQLWQNSGIKEKPCHSCVEHSQKVQSLPACLWFQWSTRGFTLTARFATSSPL